MHFEILVEDQSGKEALDILLPKIIDAQDTFKVRGYKRNRPHSQKSFKRC